MPGIGMFDKILEFEHALAEYTGAPRAIMTDCCTHAIELCMRYQSVTECRFTAYTYLSVVMTMHKLDVRYRLTSESWLGEYRFHDTNIWDSARLCRRGMYRAGNMQCLSFGHTKPLEVGRGGAILLDDEQAYQDLIRMRYDGRDLSIAPWIQQQKFRVGYHYRPTIEEAETALSRLQQLQDPEPVFVQYPDCRTITIT